MTTTMMNHLTEDEAARVVDEQLDSDEAARITEHLASCAECRETVMRGRLRKERLSALLRSTDFAVPHMSPPRAVPNVTDIASARSARARRSALLIQPRMRVAAAIILVLLGTLAIEPVRAAVTTWLRAQWERVLGPDEMDPSRTDARPATPVAPLGARIEFAHESSVLQLDFDLPANGAALQLWPSSSSNVSAEANTANADLLVLPEGLRITNASPDATYKVTLPPTVSTVVVSSRGRIVRRLGRDEIGTGTTIQLQQ